MCSTLKTGETLTLPPANKEKNLTDLYGLAAKRKLISELAYIGSSFSFSFQRCNDRIGRFYNTLATCIHFENFWDPEKRNQLSYEVFKTFRVFDKEVFTMDWYLESRKFFAKNYSNKSEILTMMEDILSDRLVISYLKGTNPHDFIEAMSKSNYKIRPYMRKN